MLLAGKTPTSVRGTVFGANLLAIYKKSGDIRPIAVGYVWRRQAAKVACCSDVEETSAALLAQGSLGSILVMMQRQLCGGKALVARWRR